MQKRVVIFSHFSVSNSIEDYVIYYLKELKKFADTIVFVSDCNDITPEETNKIKDLVSEIIVGHHGEYDFGSYKRGFVFALNNNLLDSAEELIFANDSAYAPLFPFDDLFNKMSDDKTSDFWGITENINLYYSPVKHVQSYFVAFKPQCFKSEIFTNFIKNITAKENKDDIIRDYECGLTKALTEAGYKYNIYCEISKKYSGSESWYYKKLISQDKCPFLKRSIPMFRDSLPVFGLKHFIKTKTDYDYKLIEKDIKNNRTKKLYKIIHILIYKTIKWHKKILLNNIDFIKL